MRPPMQPAALQQNEKKVHRQHSIQYPQQQQPQQQHPPHLPHRQSQLSAQITAIDTPSLQARQFKFEQNDFAVEKHLNFVTGTPPATTGAPKLPPRSHTHRQQQQQQQQQQPTYQQHSQFAHSSGHQVGPATDDCIQLLDFGKSPPHVPLHSAAYAAAQHSAVADTFRCAPSAHRSSVVSQYSRSSSSEDGSISGDRLFSYQRASHFDDAAENFIIHFPADSPAHNQNDCGLILPLSETEPLLTNVEATVADTQRAIRLNKNSASLIFTKKEVLPHKATALPRHCAPAAALHSVANNNCSTQKRQQRKQQLQHSLSLRSTTDYNRTQSKHLPATYHHQQQQQQSTQQLQHRRSLQLNYNNNNLVTTSSCSANNNFCCPVGTAPAKYSAGSSTGIGGAALHAKHYRHQHLGALTTSASAANANANANTNANINTAAATRKQHAYSWYAPVYSALEEELEHDSRDSSPIHNLANTKKQHTSHYQHRSTQNSSSAADNETVALLETRNHINIQAQLHAQANHSNGREGGRHQHSHSQPQRRSNAAAPVPTSLPLPLSLPHAHNATLGNGGGGGGLGGGNAICGVVSDDTDYNGGVLASLNGYEVEAPLVSSLGLAGGQLPRRRRIENFLKSLVGLKPSSARSSNNVGNAEPAAAPMPIANSGAQLPAPASPEITITRTPSEQNLVVLRDPAGRSHRQELLSCNGDKPASGSTSSLNVVQQKLWNIMRRNGSATSLHQEKSQSIVQYKGMRKCETVLALTRQTHSLCSPVFGGGTTPTDGMASGMRRTHTTGSGIFNANGVEQIRPLNRLRSSVSNMNATCSRCSSLLSLAASGSRYSLNMAASGGFVHAALPTSVSQQQLQVLSTLECKPPPHSSQHHQQQRKTNTVSSSNLSSSNLSSSRQRDDAHCGNDTGSAAFVAGAEAAATARHSSGNCSRKSSAGANSAHSASSNSPPSNLTTATLNSSYTPSTPASTPTTPTPTPTVTHSATSHVNTAGLLVDLPASALLSTTTPPSPSATTPTPAPAPPTYAPAARQSKSHAYPLTITSLLSMSSTELVHDLTDGSSDTAFKSSSAKHQPSSHLQPPAPAPFQPFTCKLCLVDVDAADEATTLLQCGCQFCTECMKAYVDFEITEGAYEISCPDAQCPAQGIMTLPEIANLATTNLMKKHHRYRLNKEIEMDKTRTWCPRAGCETVCLVGAGTHSDAAPSTSTAHGSTLTPTADGAAQLLCAVQCPSCKDEFCSACKKAWHPNVSCEENSRRLVADGQDDIGIPFDNDLIKSCPMCHVPIEKDEGCAQMMCKRCKHVFCWYCLASLDDDFLLRHYDRGPCKNKLGHSRASVVWHRAQVIGIFAGFGILLLVASPLLLLAAPCIICCKCRSCSGSKIDEGDGELDEAAALQS